MKTLFRSLYLVLSLIFALQTSRSQWIQTSSTHKQRITCFAAFEDQVFAGTGRGVCVTTDGAIWSRVDTVSRSFFIHTLVISGSRIYALADTWTGGGVFVSTDHGKNWTTQFFDEANIMMHSLALLSDGTGKITFLAGTYRSGVLRSTNDGVSWSQISTDLPNTSIDFIVPSGSNIYAGTPAGVYRSTNDGITWTQINNGLTRLFVTAMAVSGSGTLFVGTTGGCVFRSTNAGNNWTQVDYLGPTTMQINDITTSGRNIFVGMEGFGVRRSTDDGVGWTTINEGISDKNITALTVCGTNIFAGTYYGVIFRCSLANATPVERTSTDTPSRFHLEQNYPNPFNSGTSISFDMPVGSFASLRVYDLKGREVSVLFAGHLDAGRYVRHWTPAACPSGTYFYRLETGSYLETKKLVLLK